jgi:multidrug efflux system membrane fusion protein
MRLSSVLIAALLTAVLAGCFGKPPAPAAAPQMPPMPVGVAAPIERVLPQTRELVGRLEAVQTIDLRPQVSGRLEQVLVADGALVAAGQPLFKIETTSFTAAVMRAEAELARSTAQVDLAKAAFARSQQMIEQKAVSQQSFDESSAAVRVAEAAVAAARAALTTARLDVDRTTITAPIAGRIGKVQVNAGNIVQASGVAAGTVLATLVSVDAVNASFDIDEGTFARIAPRLRAAASGGPAVPVQVITGGGDPRTGTVTFIDNQIDPQSGAIRIRALIPDAVNTLTPGAFVRVILETAPPRPVLLINEKAVQAQVATRYVLTVDAKGQTAFRPVRLGETIGGLRVVEHGLAAGELIAVNNLSKIFFPGQVVMPLPADMQTTASLPPPTGAATAAPAAGPATAAGK